MTEQEGFNQEHMKIELPGTRRARPWRDSGWLEAIWAVCFTVMTLVLIFHSQIVAPAIFALVGILGVLHYENGAGFKYPGIWLASYRLRRKQYVMQGRNGSSEVIELMSCDFLNLFGTVYDAEKKTDTVYFAYKGFKHANADPEEAWDANGLIGSAIKDTVAQTVKNFAYGGVRGQRPFDPTDWAADTDERYIHPHFREAKSALPGLRVSQPQFFQDLLDKLSANPTMMLTEQDAAALAQDNLNDVWNDSAEHSAVYWSVMYLRFPRPKKWRQIAESDPGTFKAADLRGTALVRTFTALREGLEKAGFIDVSLMKIENVDKFIWRVWAARTLGEARASGHALSMDRNIPLGEELYTAFPLTPIVATNKHIVTDGVYHAVYKITGFKRKYVYPGGLFGLQVGHPHWVMGATNVRTTSAKRDEVLLRQAKNARQAELRRKHPGGYLDEKKDRDRAAADAKRVDMIYESGTKTIRMNDTEVVSAVNPDLLERRVEDFEAHMRKLQINIRRESQSSVMLDRFLSLIGVRA